MLNPFLYPGLGKQLRQVAASTGNVAEGPPIYDIEAGEFSETFAGHDCKEFMFELVFVDGSGDPASATGDIIIEKCADQNATVAGEEFDTLAIAAEYSKNWNAGEALVGHFRIQNDTDQSVRVYLQKRIY